MMDHRRLSPTCRFICNLPCDDVSTDFSFNILSLTKEGTSASGSFNMARGWIKLEANKAKYPCYSAYQLRLDSLKNWPASKTQTKEQLAEAGFFYPNMPVHDLVLCFYCDLGISDWKDNEDPWEMHALRMPNCFYLLQVKNQDLENHHSLRISTETQPSKDIEATTSTVEENSASNSETSNISSDVENTSNASALSVKDESDTAKSSHVETNSSTSSESKSLLCKICHIKLRNTLFMPCQHLVSCNTCAKTLERKCPTCLKHIDQIWSVQIV